jgi:hypothetical protein
MTITKNNDGWTLETSESLTDAEAAALTIRAGAGEVWPGQYVEVVDDEGIRIGHVSSAVYYRDAFGPDYVIARLGLL